MNSSDELTRWLRALEGSFRENAAQLARLASEAHGDHHAVSLELRLQAGSAERSADVLATLRAHLGDLATVGAEARTSSSSEEAPRPGVDPDAQLVA